MLKIYSVLSMGLLAFSSSAYSDFVQNPSYANYDNSNYSNDNFNRNTSGRGMVSDRELAEKIHDKLGAGWFSKGYDQVTFQVTNGAVILQGAVQTQSDKDKIEKEIRNLEGVRNLDSRLTVLDANATKDDQKKIFAQDRFATSADRQLNNKIRDTVSKGWLWDSYKDVILNTSNGVVTLEGIVNNAKDQKKLVDEIQKIEGVRAVNSNLTLKNND